MTGPLTGEHHVRSSVPAIQYVTERVRQGRCRGEGGGPGVEAEQHIWGNSRQLGCCCWAPHHSLLQRAR